MEVQTCSELVSKKGLEEKAIFCGQVSILDPCQKVIRVKRK